MPTPSSLSRQRRERLPTFLRSGVRIREPRHTNSPSARRRALPARCDQVHPVRTRCPTWRRGLTKAKDGSSSGPPGRDSPCAMSGTALRKSSLAGDTHFTFSWRQQSGEHCLLLFFNAIRFFVRESLSAPSCSGGNAPALSLRRRLISLCMTKPVTLSLDRARARSWSGTNRVRSTFI